METESWRRNLGGGIMEGRSWRWYHGGEIADGSQGISRNVEAKAVPVSILPSSLQCSGITAVHLPVWWLTSQSFGCSHAHTIGQAVRRPAGWAVGQTDVRLVRQLVVLSVGWSLVLSVGGYACSWCFTFFGAPNSEKCSVSFLDELTYFNIL